MPYISTVGLNQDQINDIRANYLGASEVGSALGLNPFQSPYNLWRHKTKDPYYIPFAGNESTKWGIRLEEAIAQGFAEDYKCKVKRDNKIRVHPNEILSCSLDRVITQDGQDGPGILEIKNIGQYTYEMYQRNETEIPLYYYAQHQQQFAITGYKWGYFVMLVGGHDLKPLPMIPDEEYIRKQTSYATLWWQAFVQTKVRPVWGIEDIRNPMTVDLHQDPVDTEKLEIFETYNKINDLNKQINELEKEKKELQNLMIGATGGHKTLTYRGNKIGQFVEYFKFNESDFKDQEPDKYEEYKTIKVRQFRLSNYTWEEQNDKKN